VGVIPEIGILPGQAADGSRSPDALITAPGQLIYGSAANLAAALAAPTRGQVMIANSTPLPSWMTKGSAGQVLGWDANDAKAIYAPGYLIGIDAGGANTPSNTTNETSILNAAITSALPAFVAVGDSINLRSWGHAIFGGTGTLTLNIYAGSTKIATTGASANFASGTERGFLIDIWIDLLSSTTVTCTGFMVPRGPSGAGFGGLTAATTDIVFAANDAGEPVTITTLPQNIDIKAVTSINTATTQVRSRGTRVRYYPKNY